MIFGLFTLLVALTISAVAAYYSIAGLCAIFAAAVVPIIIMGAALELGKITATVWLHKYWHRCALQFKLYLVPAIVVLMIITSMGIFGFLSKAHMDQTVTVGDSAAQVAILDEKIKTEKDNIDSAKKALQQMDSQVDQLLGRTDDDKGANRAVQVRRQQGKERKALQAEITQAQKHIAELQNERAPLAAESRKIEAEVGPIRYIAALIYGDNPDANLLERAVRWVIILLVLVFDPLALVLILAAEQTIEWARTDRKPKKDSQPEGWHQEWVPDTENPWQAEPKYELDDGPLTDAEIDEINRRANVQVSTPNPLFEEPGLKEFFEQGRELAQAIDSNDGKFPEDIPVLENEETWASRVIDENTYIQNGKVRKLPEPVSPDPAPINIPKSSVIIEGTQDPVPIITAPNQVVIPDLSIQAEADSGAVQAGFGSKFPPSPNKGDMFIRVDYLPNKLYKWNGQKWIEVDKSVTDSFAYDEAYIKHLVEKLASGEYDVELLTATEQEQISRYLKNGNINQQ